MEWRPGVDGGAARQRTGVPRSQQERHQVHSLIDLLAPSRQKRSGFPLKKIQFELQVPAQIRNLPQDIAIAVLHAMHRYPQTGAGDGMPLSGELEGLLRLRIGNHRVFFMQTAATVTIHRVRNRRIHLAARSAPITAGQSYPS